MFLNQIGNIVREEWLKSAQIRKEIELDEWVNYLMSLGMRLSAALQLSDKSIIESLQPGLHSSRLKQSFSSHYHLRLHGIVMIQNNNDRKKAINLKS